MSITASNPNQINQAPTNKSPSKALYSFPKSHRFPGQKKDIPPPNSYNTKSDFKTNPSTKAWSFGIAREAYAKVYLKSHPPKDKSIPGPGQYKIPEYTGNESAKYTMRPKTPNHMLFTTVRNNPGPGQYNSVSSLNNTGSYFFSKYKNSGATVINPQQSKRFNDSNDITLELKQAPGPGQYSPKFNKMPTGNARTFYHFDRDTLKLPSSARSKTLLLVNPGPGTYRIPSEFGYYESKDKEHFMATARHRTTSSMSNIGRKSRTKKLNPSESQPIDNKEQL